MKFIARYLEPSIGTVTANMLFADPETNPDEPAVLLFSRTVEFENTAYYFEINDQSNSSYGGLEEVRLARNTVHIRVAPPVVAKFGDEDFAEVHVTFEADAELYAEILKTMRVIFANANILVIE